MAIAWAVGMTAAAPAAGAETPDNGGAARSIALAPGAGALGGAVAAELKRHGYAIVPLEPAVASLGSASKMPDLDGVLAISSVSDVSGDPQTVTAQITAPDGQVLARVNWSNYWGGWRGAKGASPQQNRHRDLTQAAHEIAYDLISRPL